MDQQLSKFISSYKQLHSFLIGKCGYFFGRRRGRGVAALPSDSLLIE
jgi:hypothetical protein